MKPRSVVTLTILSALALGAQGIAYGDVVIQSSSPTATTPAATTTTTTPAVVAPGATTTTTVPAGAPGTTTTTTTPAATAVTPPIQNQTTVVQPAAPATTVVVNDHQDNHKGGEFTVRPGAFIPTGSSNDYLGNGFQLDLAWLGRIHQVAKMGIEGGYMFGSDLGGTLPGRLAPDVNHDGRADAQRFTSNISARIAHLTPAIKIGPTVHTGNVTMEPFVIGGGGYYWTHYTSGQVTLTSGGAGVAGQTADLPSHNDHNGGWNVGGGIDFHLPQDLALGFEVRYHKIIYSSDSVEFIVPAARLSLLF